MGTGLTTDQELKIENSRQLTNVSLVLIPLVGVVVGFVLQFREVELPFWIISIGSILALAASVYMGGRGISRLRRGRADRFSSFNAQAVFCLIGFLLLLSLYFCLGSEKTKDTERKLSAMASNIEKLSVMIETIRERMNIKTKALERNNQSQANDLKQITTKLSEIQRDLAVLKERMKSSAHNSDEHPP